MTKAPRLPVKRVNVSMPPDWHAALMHVLTEKGWGLSEWILWCAEAEIGKDITKTLSPKPKGPGRMSNVDREAVAKYRSERERDYDE